ncbi:MAG: phosphatase domain-containing protein [bacterium]
MRKVGLDRAARPVAALPVAVFRWDLDKTYLRTDFESLRQLIRVPFQSGADKVEVPGVAELVRGLREAARLAGRQTLVYFLSASPPQIAASIREKLALDGVEIDGIVFKDQLHILMRGRFRGLREQTGFKLTELLRGRLAVPDGAEEYLFGDDWEADPFIYSLYADVLAGRVGIRELTEILCEIPVDREWREKIERLVPQIRTVDAVRRIFINLERQSPPGSFRAFGPRLVPAFNYFQTAACLYDDGQIDVDGVERVGRTLIARDGYTREMLENSLDDVSRRGHLGDRARLRLGRALRRLGLLPARRVPLRAWVRAMLTPSAAAPATIK